jgi:isocitrate/isopropylmalate dehydrogenase
MGLRAGARAAAWALVFAGLGYLVQTKLEADLENSIDAALKGATGWAQRVKREDPSMPVYMQIRIEAKDYSNYVPLLGWMPEAPVLHMIGFSIVREEINPPIVNVRDERLNMLRPGATTTITYTELMVP